jgi:hypothetical protein
MKIMTERLEKKLNPNPKIESFVSISDRVRVSSSCVSSVSVREGVIGVLSETMPHGSIDCDGKEIVTRLHRLSIAAVMNEQRGIPQLHDFIVNMQSRVDDISLSADQVEACTALLGRLVDPPSSVVRSSVSLQSSRCHPLSGTVTSSLCSFLRNSVQKLSIESSLHPGIWTFDHTADILFNLKSMSSHDIAGNKDHVDLISDILHIHKNLAPESGTADTDIMTSIPEVISLRSLSRAAAGLQRLPADHRVTKDCFRLVAEKLQQYCLQKPHRDNSVTTPDSLAVYRDTLSLFRALKHQTIVGPKRHHSPELKAYVSGLASALSSERFQSLPGTVDGIYNDVISNLKNLKGKSREEAALLKSINGILLKYERNSSSGSIPSMKTCCNAVEGLQSMSSVDSTVRSLLTHLTNSINMSQSSMTSSMFSSILRGLSNKNVSSPEVYELVNVVNKKLKLSHVPPFSTDLFLLQRDSKDTSDTAGQMVLQAEPFQDFIKLLPFLKTERPEVREFLAIMTAQTKEMLSKFLQHNDGLQSSVYHNFTFRGVDTKSDTNTQQPLDHSYSEKVLNSVRNSMQMLDFLCHGIRGCRFVNAQSIETLGLLDTFGNGIKSIRTIIESQKLDSRAIALSQLSSSSGDDVPTIMEDVQVLSAMDPVTIMKSFEGLSNMKGNNPQVIGVLTTLTGILDESLDSVSSRLSSFTGSLPNNVDVYRVLWNVRGLYPNNNNNSPQMNDLLKTLVKSLRLANSCTNGGLVPTKVSEQTLWQTVYSFQNLSSDNSNTRRLLQYVTSDIHAIDPKTISLSKRKGTHLQDALFGLRGMKSSYSEVRDLLSAVTKVMISSKDIWETAYLASTMSSLQFMNSDDKGVSEFVQALADKLTSASDSVSPQQFNKCIDSLRGLSSDVPEVRSLLSVIMSKVSTQEERQGNAGKLPLPSLIGFQRMNSNHVEVRRLLEIYTTSLLATTADMTEGNKVPVTKKGTNVVLGTLHGMRLLNSDHIEVRDAVGALAAYLKKRIELSGNERSGGSQSFPYIGFVASSVYGMQLMSSEHVQTLELLGVLSNQAYLCSTNGNKRSSTKKLSPREVGMAIIGMQKMSSDCREVRHMVKNLLPHIHHMDQISPSNSSYLNWYVESCIGLQLMSSDHSETTQLVQVVTKRIQDCTGNLTTSAIAKAFIGIRNLRELNNSLPIEQSPAIPGCESVNNLIGVLVDKITASRLFQNEHAYNNEDGAINGEFVCAAFYGLKNRSSDVVEVQRLMSVLQNLLQRCPVSLNSIGTTNPVLDSRSITTGLTSFQLSSCFACLNGCQIDSPVALDLVNALIRHIRHLRDKNVQEAVSSITHHFSQSEVSEDMKPKVEINAAEVFTGRHLSNILFGLRRLDVGNVGGDKVAVQCLTNLFTTLNDMVYANCNTTLSERIIRGVTISIRDSNNSIWSGEDICVAMGAISFCHILPDERDYEVPISDVIYDESEDENGNTGVYSVADDADVFSLNPFVYDMVNILADSLHNMELNTRKNNSAGEDLIDGDDHFSSNENNAGKDSSELKRVISVPHLARGASGLRHLSAENESVQRALHAIVDRLRDTYFNHYFSQDKDIEDARTLLLAKMSVGALDQYLQDSRGNCSPLANANVTPCCTAIDLSRLLSAVGKMNIRYSAVGDVYNEVAKLIYDPRMALMFSKNSCDYHPAAGHMSFADISQVMSSLQYNQCSSEVRYVVESLTTQLRHLRQRHIACSDEHVGVCGHELSEMMTGVSSMTSTVEEVRLFLKELHLYLKHHQTRGGSDSGVHVPITAGDISACLGSMAHMEAQVKEVQDLLLYFGDRIEESSDSELRFSVNEMYVALDSVSGLSIGGVDSDRERAIIHRLIDLIRQRSC